ncbi:MAG: ActS/PrrB/RegB family redox-sensitive histidine kinase [Pseudomonadota bacterium]
MPQSFTRPQEEAIRSRVLIRLDTFIRLRWYAIIGQAGAVIVVAAFLGYEMPWALCAVLIALSAALNVLLSRHYKSNHRLQGDGAFALLAFDILQLGVLLYLTGGLRNPFAILVLAPVVVSSTSLKRNHTLGLGCLAVTVISLLAFFHQPLPWEDGWVLQTPGLFTFGTWTALVCTLAFTAIYAFRVAEETRKLADALSATELVLQREQHLSALDGLAAAAAHELGTPLATIALVSKEMVNTLPADSALCDDAKLLRAQAERCRDILQKLTSLSSDSEAIMQEQPIMALIEEEVAPLRDFGIKITIKSEGEGHDMPVIARSPGVHYGLGNLIDNAVDFAQKEVVVSIAWDETFVRLEISDDGPGFPTSILDKVGEPFVTSRRMPKGSRPRGMGLGLFIAKTLLERSGAEIFFSNKTSAPDHLGGAFVSVVWRRERLAITPPDEGAPVATTTGDTIPATSG